MSILSNLGAQVTNRAWNETHGNSILRNTNSTGGKYSGDTLATGEFVPSVESGSPPVTGSSDSSFSFGGLLSGVGSVLGGIGSIAGGLLSWHEQKKANKMAAQQFAENMAFQKDQFYNAIQHRVADAIKAGVHPLAALGISAHGSASPTAHAQAATGLGNAVSSAGHVVQNYFSMAQQSAQIDAIQSQIATNKAMALKLNADAVRSNAETAMVNKELNNYHIYRAWNSVNNSIRALTGFVPKVSFNSGAVEHTYRTFTAPAERFRYDGVGSNGKAYFRVD